MEIVVLIAIVLIAAAIALRTSLPGLASRFRLAVDAFVGRSAGESSAGVAGGRGGRRLVEAAAAAVDEARRAGGTTPTLVDVACSPHDHRLLSARLGEVERALAARVGADVRLCLREFGELRHGSFLVLGTDDGDATSVLGLGMADTVAFAAAADATRALPSAALLTETGEHVLGPAATVGRSATSGVMLASRHLSGRHATIELVGRTWLLVDHSSNGTWVGGRRIERDEPYPIQDGDRLRFADVECTFVVAGA
jgi:hypothetical protein